MRYADVLMLMLLPFLMISVIIGVIWSQPAEDIVNHNDKCYDKYGSEIKDTTCISTEFGIPTYAKIFFTILALIALIAPATKMFIDEYEYYKRMEHYDKAIKLASRRLK